jgi:hypothetical protein
MEIKVQPTPQIGTWDKLSATTVERKPRLDFDMNIPVEVIFTDNEPREYTGETGAYYIFDVKVDGKELVLITSAWTLLRSLKSFSPLKGKKLKIVKKIIKGKQNFEVEAI